ncbi:MAG: cytochrome c biogenesis heme-transporting ATPase CcmA [Gammaproteobacteria bacterium]
MSNLKAENLTLWRGELCLFDRLSFSVSQGEVMQVRGPNGAGKTTLLRVLAGLTRAETGRVSWSGEATTAQRSEFGLALAYCGHQTGLKGDLSLRGNLAFSGRLAGLAGEPWLPLLDQLGLTASADRLVRHLSAGQQRRGALARALMLPARLWILDEPFTNLDGQGREFLEDRLDQHLSGDGLAVIAAHHDLRERTGLRRLELGVAE